MSNMDYKQGNSDHTLFIKMADKKVSILLLYVDDMVIIRYNKNEIIRLKKKLCEEFELKDLGKLRYFWGVKFVRSNGLVMNKMKYTVDLLKEKGMYQHLVEKLIYLILTRSNITCAINIVSQFMLAATDAHMKRLSASYATLKIILKKFSCL